MWLHNFVVSEDVFPHCSHTQRHENIYMLQMMSHYVLMLFGLVYYLGE